MKRIYVVLCILCALALILLVLSCPVYGNSKEYMRQRTALAKKLSETINPRFIDSIFSDPRLSLDSSIIRMKPKPVDYSFLYTDSSIADSRAFLARNRPFLDSLDAQYGVPPEILVAIYRIETNFGRFLGKHVAARALFTRCMRAWDSRAFNDRFKELQCFLELAYLRAWDVFSFPSSHAGAFGLTQFMPRSYVYSADGDGDGLVDLFNERDALASAANFLKQHGWKPVTHQELQTLQAYNSGTYAYHVRAYAEKLRSSE